MNPAAKIHLDVLRQVLTTSLYLCYVDTLSWEDSLVAYLVRRLLQGDPLVVLVQRLLHVNLERPLALTLGAGSRFDFLWTYWIMD